MAPRSSKPVKVGISIERDSPLPYYLQLKNALIEQIESGYWQPGDQLPGEPEFCRHFSVSRTVVRQALKEMTYEGMIFREKGRGTFIAEPKISSTSLVHSLVGFHQDMTERGLTMADKILEQSILPASQKVASNLQLEELSPVIKINRLRYVEDEPVVLVASFLPYEPCRKLVSADLTEESLYAYLEKEYDLRIVRGRRLIDAVGANEYQSNLLEIDIGSPLIRIESISYLKDDTPIEYFLALFRGDRSRFEVEILRFQGQGKLREAMGIKQEEEFLI
ncbi:MAG: GntR family transcriptional regulator [Anaerolineales bacterium]|nr:GntR family transcriptional regulator [Anaerolineales bacterium]